MYGPWGGCIMEGMCNSSFTLLPLSFLTFNEEGSGSFASNHLSCLVPWLFCSAIMILLFRLLLVMSLVHAFDLWALF